MELKSKIPTGPIEQKWDKHRFEMKLVNPANKRKFTVHRGRQRAGRRRGRGHAERARLQREVLLLPGLAPAGALDRGAGRDQRGQELPQRRRQHLPAVLRHGEGRRLPRPRGQRLPPGPDQRRDHRPVRGPGRAVRPRVRRAAGQPVVRRRAGLAHLLRAGPDRPAAPARCLPGAGEGGGARRRHDVPAHRDARPRRDRRPRPRHRRARHGDRARSRATPATPWCSAPAATATSSTCRPTPRARTPPPSGARTSAGPRSPTRATPRSIRPASRSAASTSRSSP